MPTFLCTSGACGCLRAAPGPWQKKRAPADDFRFSRAIQRERKVSAIVSAFISFPNGVLGVWQRGKGAVGGKDDSSGSTPSSVIRNV